MIEVLTRRLDIKAELDDLHDLIVGVYSQLSLTSIGFTSLS